MAEDRVLAVDVTSRKVKSAQVVCVRDVVGAPLVEIGLDQVGIVIFSDSSECTAAQGLLPISFLQALPRDEQGRILSLGSRSHSSSVPHGCIPCKFACTVRGCHDGVLCGLCHFPHSEMTRLAKRTLIQKRAFVRKKSDCTLESFLPCKHAAWSSLLEAVTLAAKALAVPTPGSAIAAVEELVERDVEKLENRFAGTFC